MDRKFRGVFRAFLAAVLCLGALLGLLFGEGVAEASGTFHLRSTEVQEVSGGWHVYVDLALARAPSTPHIPMRFLFTKTMVYERALVDNSKDPVLNRTALQNQTPSVESLDVDFSDPRGKVFNRTRFDFSLTRTRGYEAGEYKVQVRTSDGTDVGASATLILKGDNPVVDRRSITFDAKKKDIRKVDDSVDGGGQTAKNDSDDNSAAPASTDVAPVGSAPPFIPADAYNKTPEEETKEHPKGCGCSVPGLRSQASNLLFAGVPLLGLAGIGLGGRRRRRSEASNRSRAPRE